MKRLLSKIKELITSKANNTQVPEPEIEDDDDFGDVVNNNVGILMSKDKEVFDIDEMIYYSTKIDLNRHNANTFEKKFYKLLFDSELMNIRFIIAAKHDEIKEATHEHDIMLAETIHHQANCIFEREKAKFVLYSMENFKDESLLMIKSMKAKNIIANSMEDIDLYFTNEWQTRKNKSYPTVVAKLKLVEVAIFDEYKKLKIIPDTPPEDDFLSDSEDESSSKSSLNFK